MTVGLHPVLADLLTPEEQDSDIKKSEDNMQVSRYYTKQV
jgi:hypothetical protein